MEQPPPFEANITADEIVRAGSTIELNFATPVDPRSAQSAVRLMRRREPVDVVVRTARRGRTVAIPLDADLIGAFAIVVADLLNVKGERLVDYGRLPFSIIPVSGKVPGGVRIEHATRLVIRELEVVRLGPGDASETGFVDVLKVVNRRTGAASEMAFDERGQKVDASRLLAELEQRRARKYGRLHETLFARLQAARPGERVPVVVWPRLSVQPAPYEKPSDRRSLEPPEAEQRLAKTLRKAADELKSALSRYKVAVPRGAKRFDDAMPFVRVTATAAQLREMAGDKSIGAIYFDDTTSINDLGTSIAVARSDRAHAAGFDGTGIRVAVFENGPRTTTNLVFAARFSNSPSASTAENNHARLTSAIVRNTEANRPHGHAPDCDLYSANSADNDALRWAVRDQRCTVVSQSFHRSSEPGGAGLQSDDLLKDWLALRWPYPTIVQAAGNYWATDPDNISPPEDEYVNHKGFNSLNAGNHDDTAAAMSGSSVFRNPASAHGDRELPEIAANGTGVSANGQNMDGTSFAAPAVAGVAALLQDVDGVLCSWPEGCRAILLASAGRNVRGSTWWQDVVNGVDGRDGAGAVDARAGVSMAQQRRAPNAPATRHGWDVGTLSSALIGADGLTKFRYRVSVPARLLFPTVKVALAWDSAVTAFLGIPLASRLSVDLDLSVRDSRGIQVASSASWDNSYEIVEFSARRGETYEIVIRRFSGTDSVWYGIAWTVFGLSLWFPTDVVVTELGM